jgi:hypothetical protein
MLDHISKRIEKMFASLSGRKKHIRESGKVLVYKIDTGNVYPVASKTARDGIKSGKYREPTASEIKKKDSAKPRSTKKGPKKGGLERIIAKAKRVLPKSKDVAGRGQKNNPAWKPQGAIEMVFKSDRPYAQSMSFAEVLKDLGRKLQAHDPSTDIVRELQSRADDEVAVWLDPNTGVPIHPTNDKNRAKIALLAVRAEREYIEKTATEQLSSGVYAMEHADYLEARIKYLSAIEEAFGGKKINADAVAKAGADLFDSCVENGEWKAGSSVLPNYGELVSYMNHLSVGDEVYMPMGKAMPVIDLFVVKKGKLDLYAMEGISIKSADGSPVGDPSYLDSAGQEAEITGIIMVSSFDLQKGKTNKELHDAVAKWSASENKTIMSLGKILKKHLSPSAYKEWQKSMEASVKQDRGGREDFQKVHDSLEMSNEEASLFHSQIHNDPVKALGGSFPYSEDGDLLIKNKALSKKWPTRQDGTPMSLNDPNFPPEIINNIGKIFPAPPTEARRKKIQAKITSNAASFHGLGTLANQGDVHISTEINAVSKSKRHGTTFHVGVVDGMSGVVGSIQNNHTIYDRDAKGNLILSEWGVSQLIDKASRSKPKKMEISRIGNIKGHAKYCAELYNITTGTMAKALKPQSMDRECRKK